MQEIAKFEKVSYEQFKKDLVECNLTQFTDSEIKDIYDNIKLPSRSTVASAGYDFFAPFNICIEHGKTIKMPTGIRVFMDDGWVLQCYPRSGLGFKYRMQLDNTVGIIDGDYVHSDNEGHIMAKFTNDSKSSDKTINIKQGNGYMQGIFVQYGITKDDLANGIRNGGFGSTDK